jgi:sugar/nucleoside kinase (ribokinase family)
MALKKHIKVLSVGTAALDHNLSNGKIYAGGCQLNCAIFAKILSCHTSDFLGVLANDTGGDFIRNTLSKYEVGYKYCRNEIGETPYCNFETIDGEREFRKFEKGVAKSNPLILNRADSAYISDFNVVFTGRTANIDTQLNMIPRHCLVVYDCQYNVSDLTLLSDTVDMVIFSGAEWSKDEINKQIENSHKIGIPCVLVTLGADGQIFSMNGQRVVGVATNVEAVDTLGCGDAFATAFALRLFEDGWRKRTLPKLESIENSLLVASEFAARIATTDGAFGACIK